jgi:hypothetical protein
MDPDTLKKILAGINQAMMPAIISVAYLLVKMLARAGIRILCELQYDYRDTAIWFPVDLGVLAIGLSAGASVHRLLPEGTATLYYIMLGACILGCLLMYGGFHKLRAKEHYKTSWTLLGLSEVFGIIPFVTVTRLIAAGRP